MVGDEDRYRLDIRCPVCGSVYPVDTTLGQLRELFRQDYPVAEIYPEKSMHEYLPLLAGICPGCWQKITGKIIYDGTQSMPVHPVLLEQALRTSRKPARVGRPKKIKYHKKRSLRYGRSAARRLTELPQLVFYVKGSKVSVKQWKMDKSKGTKFRPYKKKRY